MAIYTMKEILKDAQQKGYGVGAYNVMDLIMARACIEAAEIKQAPIIIGPACSQLKYPDSKFEWLLPKLIDAARKTKIPVAIHLDHTSEFKVLMQALRYGFGSIMYDGSMLSYEENVINSAKIVNIAHSMGVGVECELGLVGKEGGNSKTGKDIDNQYTDPEQVIDFVDRTDIDFLAISIGTIHCKELYPVPPKLDFERLSEIRKITDVALVLHGASALGKENDQEAVKHGITKFNIYNEVVIAAKKAMVSNSDKSYAEIMLAIEVAMRDKVAERIDSLGSVKKA